MATNGGPVAATAQSPVDTKENMTTKRKHNSDAPILNGDTKAPTAEQQKDILEVLRQHDTTPYFLDFEFQDNTTSEPAPKRARTSNQAASRTSIASKLEQARYHSLQQLSIDAERVSSSIVDSIKDDRSQDEDCEDAVRPSIEDLKQVQHAKAMTRTIEELVSRELLYSEHDTSIVVRLKQEADADNTQALNKVTHQDAGTVLTLFGNAPTPKQLFSSLQHSTSGATTTKASLLIEEMSLPNGLTATKLKPSITAAQEKSLTFAEAFAPPHSLPPLAAPKAYKRPSTRDNTIAWEFKEPTRGSKRGGYTTQSLTVADWLSYGGSDPLSPREKRKQRERALSGNSSDAQPIAESIDEAAELERQEEALFRQAYSSYAPSYDNSRSLVDASLKSLVWWHKVGNKKFNARFDLDPTLGDHDAGTQTTATQLTAVDDNDDNDFAKAVEEYEEDAEQDSARNMTNVEEVLSKINDLLETLASQQYIRSATAPASSSIAKIAVSPAPVLTSRSGKPDVPSQEEVETYQDLQREIAYLVLQLPPYAVAKLNGDQLAELGVSRIIKFESGNYRGQMEEDQAARLIRYTAAAAAAGLASLTRSASNANPHYSSTSRTPAIGQSAQTRYGQSASYSSGRPSLGGAPVAQRPISGQGSYGTPTAPPRSQYTQPLQYPRTASTPQSYSQTNGQQSYQQRPASTYGYGAGYGQNNTVQRTGYASSQAAPQLQSRSQTAAANAVSYQTNYGQSASPVKSVVAQGSASSRATPVAYASPAQTPANGLQTARAPPPLIPRATSGTPQPQNGGPTSTQSLVNGHA